MKTYAYKASAELNSGLRRIVTEKYGATRDFAYYLHDFEKAYRFAAKNPHVQFVPITVEGDDGRMIGHIALIIDERRPRREGFFGFLETPNDPTVFSAQWDLLTDQARALGITKLLGPINGSIWHQYRTISETDNSDFFKSELPCSVFYKEFLAEKNPIAEGHYYSAYREKFDAIINAGIHAYADLEKRGFSLQVPKLVRRSEIEIILSLSKEIFKNSWGFVDLSNAEFADLYAPSKLDSNLDKLYMLYHGDRVIGYCSVFTEDITTLICKTMALLPEFQGQGIGNALAYIVHKDALDTGVTKMIYALIREGNNVTRFPKEDAVIFRRYSTFEFSL